MLKTQPKYVDTDSSFFEKFILPEETNLSKAELRNAIKGNYDKYFRHQSQPPRWLQNPAWSIRNDWPLFFIEQLELKSEALHDNGFVYVFMDTKTGEIETVKQVF